MEEMFYQLLQQMKELTEQLQEQSKKLQEQNEQLAALQEVIAAKDTEMHFAEWKWLNESDMMEINGELAIVAPPRTDWFNNPVPENGVIPVPVDNAPFLYMEVSGDFVFRARVRPNHRYTYDACALMVIRDE